MQGQYAHGITAAQQALTIAETIDSPELRITATHNLGLNLFATGNYHDALALFMNNVEGPDAELAQRLAAIYGSYYFQGCGFLTWCHTVLGDFAHASQYVERTTQAAERLESPQVQANALFYRAILLNHQGEFARAIPLCEQAVQLYETHGIHFMLPLALMYWGQALAWIGQSTESLAALERAVALQEDMATQYLATDGYIMWAEGLLLAGHIEEAIRVANRGIDLARATGEQGNEARALQVLGAIMVAENPPDFHAAVHTCRQAETLADKLSMRPLQAHCHRGLGSLYSQIGDAEQARAELSTAIEMYRDMEMTFWLPETEAALAAVEGR
jgi:tetratricopeptide (TPR) repeat protein